MTAPILRSVRGRRADTVQRLMEAALLELRESDDAEVTTRSIAKRANVSPATFYTYFASREHLLSAVFRQKLEELTVPDMVDGTTASARVRAVTGSLIEMLITEPAFQAPLRSSMLSADSDVRRVREEVGVIVIDLLITALGSSATPTAQRALTLSLIGALVIAGTEGMTFEEIPALMGETAALLMGELRGAD